MQVNLLTETESILKEHNFTWNGVKFIANAEGIIEIAQFVTLAKMCYYDNEWQGNNVEIDPTLVIAGGSWWLSRIKTDTVEKWLFHNLSGIYRPV